MRREPYLAACEVRRPPCLFYLNTSLRSRFLISLPTQASVISGEVVIATQPPMLHATGQ